MTLTESQENLIMVMQVGACLGAPTSGENEDVNFLIKEGYIKNIAGFLVLTKKGKNYGG